MITFRYDAVCEKCGLEYYYPSLGDFAYGEFLICGKKGGHVYLSAFNEPAWEVIDQILKPLRTMDDKIGYSSETECFQFIVGKCIDRINDEEFSIVDDPVCPNCHSTELAIYSRNIRYDVEIPVASFNWFMTLSDEEKSKMLQQIWFDCIKQKQESPYWRRKDRNVRSKI